MNELTPLETDALTELFNIGLHRAAAALSELTGQRVLVDLPRLWICPLTELHDRLLTSGLQYEQPRFTFTPHVTLNLFRELPADALRELLQVRIDEPVRIDRIAAYRTSGPTGTKRLIEVTLTGTTDSSVFRRLGIVTYGFEPFPITAAEQDTQHGTDERIRVEAFSFGMRFLYELVVELGAL